MTVMPPSFDPALAREPHEVAGLRWTALAEAANLVATLAGVEPGPATREEREFPALIRTAEAWRRERAEIGIADLSAIMEPGLAALIAVNAGGADPQPAARALWREFVAARAALVSLLAPGRA
jgi:hypothetical protein